MVPGRSNTSRIIYVARTARELPEEVQEYLSQSGIRAMAVANIYDALATLAQQRNAAVLIVSIEAVDWNEMEFFDLLRRVSRDVQVFVAAHEYQQAKLEAALQRGARPFNVDQVQEALRSTPHALRTRDLLAGRVGESKPKPSEQSNRPNLSISDCCSTAPEKSRVSEGFRYEVEIPFTEPSEPEPELAEEDESGSASDSEQTESERIQRLDFNRTTPQEGARPVRLVVDAEGENTESAVPLPWRPAPNRPTRIPPTSVNPEQPEPTPGKNASVETPVRAELTSEEIAALLGRKPAGPGVQESRS